MDRLTVSLDLSDKQHVAPPRGEEGTRTRVQAGDIVISITADLGKVAVIPEELGEAYVSQHLALCRPIPGIDAKYLAYALASDCGQRQLLALKRGATKVGLGLDDIRSTWIPVPPRALQGELVSEIEARLTEAEAAEATMRLSLSRAVRMRAAILKTAFQGGLGPSAEHASTQQGS